MRPIIKTNSIIKKALLRFQFVFSASGRIGIRSRFLQIFLNYRSSGERKKIIIIIPSFNDGDRLLMLCEYLKSFDLNFIVLIDSKSSEDHIAFVKSQFYPCEVVNNSQNIAEGLFIDFCSRRSEGIFFRLDTDEIPNKKLVDFIRDGVCMGDYAILACRRDWLIGNSLDGQSIGRVKILGPDYQWRLFDARKVFAIAKIHTSGVGIKHGLLGHLGKEYRIIHLEKLLSRDESKLQKYLSHGDKYQAINKLYYNQSLRACDVSSISIDDKKLVIRYLQNK